MILTVILIEILLIILSCVFVYLTVKFFENEILFSILYFVCVVTIIAVPIAIGALHGYVNYNPSYDKDLARITAVTQEQTAFRTYYKVEVENLTNTPTQEGMIQTKNIEKDTFYCYYEDEELANKLKNNQYKELWIISGYKGGYETYKDFGNKLIKDIQTID